MQTCRFHIRRPTLHTGHRLALYLHFQTPQNAFTRRTQAKAKQLHKIRCADTNIWLSQCCINTKPSCAIITNRFLPTKGGFTPKTRLICNASKPSLAHKTDSTDLERRLVCMADKLHPTENRTLLRHKMPRFRIANPGRTAGNEAPHVK